MVKKNPLQALRLSRQLQKLGFISLLAVFSHTIYAAGYRLEFQSPSVLADAGDAAVVEDAGTNWYNSAGLVRLPHQLTASMIDVYQGSSFNGNVVGPNGVGGPNYIASGSASSHTNSFLPAFHYAYPFKDRWAFGLSVVPAWGLLKDYGENSILRYDLTRIYTRTIDIAPSLAYKFNNQWSVGAGPDIHYWTIQSKAHVNTSGMTASDSIARYSIDDWSYGGHVGILYAMSDATRFGLNYRSKIVMKLEGYSDFMLTGLAAYENNRFTLNIPLPPTTSFSIYHDMNPCWALMGTVAYDQWSVIKSYVAHNYQSAGTIFPTVIDQQDMHNTFDLSMGTRYKLNEKWLLRGSLKYEPTPTQNEFRSIANPDGPKLGVNIGTRYQINKKLAMDLIYAHVFVRSVRIMSPYPAQLYPGVTPANGRMTTTIDLAGAQLVWDI